MCWPSLLSGSLVLVGVKVTVVYLSLKIVTPLITEVMVVGGCVVVGSDDDSTDVEVVSSSDDVVVSSRSLEVLVEELVLELVDDDDVEDSDEELLLLLVVVLEGGSELDEISVEMKDVDTSDIEVSSGASDDETKGSSVLLTSPSLELVITVNVDCSSEEDAKDEEGDSVLVVPLLAVIPPSFSAADC